MGNELTQTHAGSVGLSGKARRGSTRGAPALVLAILAASVLATMALNVSVAGAVTFHDRWQGKVVSNFTAGKVALHDLPISPQPGPIGDAVANLWSESTTQAAVCNKLEAVVAAESGQPLPVENWHCSLPATGDLQAALVGPDQLGLQFQLHGITIAFNDPAKPTDPGLRGSFNADVGITLEFAHTVDGSATHANTVTILSSQATFSDASFSSSNIFVSSGILSTIETDVDDYLFPNAASVIGLQPVLTGLDGDLQHDAAWIWTHHVESTAPDSNEVFNLSIGVGASTLTVTYERGVLEPAPVGCSFEANGTPAGGGVDALCSPHQPHGVTTLRLEDLVHGQWIDNASKDRSLEPGAGSAGPEWAFLAGPPYPGWNPNDGPDTAFSPLLVDYPKVPKHGGTVEARVCSSNPWGLDCTRPVTLHGVLPGGTGQSSGGGGGGGGAGSGEGPGATPQPPPPGTKRHCGDPGVYCQV